MESSTPSYAKEKQHITGWKIAVIVVAAVLIVGASIALGVLYGGKKKGGGTCKCYSPNACTVDGKSCETTFIGRCSPSSPLACQVCTADSACGSGGTCESTINDACLKLGYSSVVEDTLCSFKDANSCAPCLNSLMCGVGGECIAPPDAKCYAPPIIGLCDAGKSSASTKCRPCSGNEDCGGGACWKADPNCVCSAGGAHPGEECLKDEDCGDAGMCGPKNEPVAERGVCSAHNSSPAMQCQSCSENTDCGGGACWTVDANCVCANGAQCAGNADCGTGGVCAPQDARPSTTGVCSFASPTNACGSCKSDVDCGTGGTCHADLKYADCLVGICGNAAPSNKCGPCMTEAQCGNTTDGVYYCTMDPDAACSKKVGYCKKGSQRNACKWCQNEATCGNMATGVYKCLSGGKPTC